MSEERSPGPPLQTGFGGQNLATAIGIARNFPQTEPGPGEVLICIGGAGACHSDLHIMHEWAPESFPRLADWSLPFTLGHENAGWIEGGDHEGFDVGAPVGLDFVGLDATMALASQGVRKLGQIIAVGIGGGSFPFSFFALPAGCSVTATLGGTTSELAEIVALAEAGRITPHIHKSSLDEVVSVYAQLEANQIKGRAVLVP